MNDFEMIHQKVSIDQPAGHRAKTSEKDLGWKMERLYKQNRLNNL